MKYLVISDLHGSEIAANHAINAFQYHQADAIICLGDVLYHGPRNDLPKSYAPKKVISLLNPIADKIIAVRGNCDAEVDQMVLDFPLTATYSELYLENRKVFLTHGHIYSPDNLPKLPEGSLFISGHTHIPTTIYENGIYLLNPGSIAIPKQNHPASYAILTDEDFSIYQTDHSLYMKIHF